MLYLYSKLGYDERTVIDVYVNFTEKEIPECIELAAKHLLDSDNFIRRPSLRLPTNEKLPFDGGQLLFVKRTKSTPRKKALKETTFHDNN